MNDKTLCLFGAGSNNIKQKYMDEVTRLGEEMAKMGYSLIYGSGASGCMGAIARGFKNEGGYITGVAPTFMQEFEPIFDCNKFIETKDMSERRNIMINGADLFIIAPGGIGTMDEFFEIFTLKRLKRLDKDIIVLNIDGFYDEMLLLIDNFVLEGALSPEAKNNMIVFSTVDEILEYLH